MPFQISPSVNVSEIDLTTVVPAVATSTAGIAGVFSWGPAEQLTLIGSSDQLAATFGRPTSNNYETFYTGANFLAYANKLYVSRAISTTGPNTYNATANNNAAVPGNYLVKNVNDYTNQEPTINAGGTGLAYIAKYPGELGNSLKISVVDSKEAYTSSLYVQSDEATSSIAFTPGSNAAVLYVTHADDGDAAISFAETMLDKIAIGDYITAGNSSIGVQYMKVTAKGSASNTGLVAAATINFESNYNLSASVNTVSGIVYTSSFDIPAGSNYLRYGATATIRSNTIVIGTGVSIPNDYTILEPDTVVTGVLANNSGSYIYLSKPLKRDFVGADDGGYELALNCSQRLWEYHNLVDKIPQTSEYVAARNVNRPVDEMHIVVVDRLGKFTGVPGQVLEVFANVSRATDALSPQGGSLYYKTVLNNTSRYVWFGKDIPGATSNVASSVVASTNVLPFTQNFANGTDGAAESNIAMLDLARAWDKFKSPEEVDVSFLLQGKSIASGNYVQLANYLTENIAEYRKDCVVCLSPNLEAVVNNLDPTSSVVNYRNRLNNSSYMIIDSGYKYQYDKYNDVFRWIPLNGDIAGLMARTDSVRDPWFSPAGYNRGRIKNVIKIAYNPDKSQRDIIYKSDINPVIVEPGQGVLLFGDKTGIGKPSAFDRINVRRLFIVLEKAIATAAKFTLFEFNDQFTRAQFRNLVEPFLRDVLGRRGIYDFRVVCDETNNTDEVIDRNEFVGDIYIKPAKSINFIQLNFVAVRSGVTFDEIVGSFG
jgi:hypothetical protein